MSALGSKLRRLEGGRVAFWCPGCGEAHQVTVDGSRGWTFNGNGDKPTFSPSVLVRGIRSPSGADVMTDAEDAEYDDLFKAGGPEAVFNSRFGSRCHSFVTDGRIQFLSDCTHGLAGQTVDMPDFPAGEAEADQ